MNEREEADWSIFVCEFIRYNSESLKFTDKTNTQTFVDTPTEHSVNSLNDSYFELAFIETQNEGASFFCVKDDNGRWVNWTPITLFNAWSLTTSGEKL